MINKWCNYILHLDEELYNYEVNNTMTFIQTFDKIWSQYDDYFPQTFI